MIKIENRLGTISIASDYFAELVGSVASSCFGVAGMVVSDPIQSFRSMTTARRHFPDKGVKVIVVNDELVIDLHIAIAYGVNVNAIVATIVSQVKYAVEEATSLKVQKVNVFIDQMIQ